MSENPFKIEGPAVISFSGGRTSAYMLRRILDAYDGVLPSNIHVLFANTGKEREETLEFIHTIEILWNVPIVWIERARSWPTRAPRDQRYVEVSYDTASRNGEPFEALLTKRNYLPNPVMRFCTQELKIHVMKDWMLSHGYDYWTNVVGLRADEPRRVSRLRGAGEARKERWDVEMPLADAGVTQAEVLAFWATAPFDLQLQSHEGNCDLCFLKTVAKKSAIMQDHPDLAFWWMDQEKRIGATFRKDQPSFEAIFMRLVPIDETELQQIDCLCTD